MLYLDTLRMSAAALGPENPLPSLTTSADPHSMIDVAVADATMRANMAYGHLSSILPYTMQDGYTRERVQTDVTVAVLKNEVLQATFLLDYGGRLWSLVHLPSGRELVYSNPILQPANLGLRNAWFAGGVEWNIGTTGHSPLTCSPVHAVRIKGADGTPILRLYEFERARQLVYAIDAWLPPGSPALLVAIRIVNPTDKTVPIYWWSNIAVPEADDMRVLAPAESAYHFGYARKLQIVDFPRHEGTDVSYPARSQTPSDWFFECGQHRRPWIAALDGQGDGLVQVSTRRLKGRKLFVWGRSQGGRRWQELLSGPNHRYFEIQAGLARTQLEHEPLPAGERWSWVEAYGFAQADPAKIHGDWHTARAAVESAIETLVPSDTLDQALAEADARAEWPPDDTLHHGSGWGALEELRRACLDDPPFGLTGTPFSPTTMGPEQAPWSTLLHTGRIEHEDPTKPPVSYVVGEGWAQLIEDAADSWASWLHRGILRWYAGDRAGSCVAFERSLRCEKNAWALRNLAVAAYARDDPKAAAVHLREAHRLISNLRPLTIELLDALILAGLPAEALAVIDRLDANDRFHGRIRLLELRAAISVGALNRAEAIFKDEDLVIDDLREGEDSLDSLWWAYHEARAEATARGSVSNEQYAQLRFDHPLPARLDFRMG